MKINMKKLKAAIHDIHRELKAQKGDGPSGAPTTYRLNIIKQQMYVNELRGKGQEQLWWNEYKNLEIMRDTKRYATVLYSIRANNRSKVHQTKIRNSYAGMPDVPKIIPFTLEEQQKLIEPFIHEFEAQTEAVG